MFRVDVEQPNETLLQYKIVFTTLRPNEKQICLNKLILKKIFAYSNLTRRKSGLIYCFLSDMIIQSLTQLSKFFFG